MASRSLGELLLRPSTLTRIPQTSSTQCMRRTAPSWTCQRAMSTTPRRLAQPPRKDDDLDFIPKQEAQNQTPHTRYVPEREAARPQPRQATQDETTQAIDSLFGGRPTNRTPPSYMPRNAPRNPTADPMRKFGSEFSRSSPGGGRPSLRPQGLDLDAMNMPQDELTNPNLANKPSEAASLAVQQEETFSSYPHLNPAYGRAIDLDATRGRDIVRGIGMLGSLMARNKVKADFNKQRFHERGGLKRKRLLSERWRARFKAGFREITGRVTELTRKGW
jgi:small subunit ribosomal protein MRP21